MRQTSRFFSVAISAVLLAGLAACETAPMSSSDANYPSYPARSSSYPAQYPQSSYPAQYPQSQYPQSQYPQGNYVEYGRVSNVEVIRTQEQGKGSGVGAVLGGVAGAVVGHQIGGGHGRDAATVVGAVGGAVAGNAIEKNRNTNVRETYRISVQLDNGVSRAYDVPSYGDLRVGDRVRIENGQLFRM